MNLHNKNGRVSAYGFACGCVEQTRDDSGAVVARLEMPSPSAGVYRVTGARFVTYQSRSIAKARKAYRAAGGKA